ncbi:uncharacterized protein KQ657_003448 [Scheffersomyces spartinae]|uniref:Uncharacterized protein n=1 Tax=Scheffersomyces spartinae TaxID=45513 RepID=A0A9P7V5P0_9ASCO|nr:uncharacterized protein KQ657_003448 [Scheffersomyces spartinae]KAG7191404.1 hypothetical protein KQ657_003448 [Scheffersomyces spartinae]
MPDLFDNFFAKIGTKLNGGHLLSHYQMSNQVNTGSYYHYHSLALNNHYWLPQQKKEMSEEMKNRMLKDITENKDMTEMRRGSVSSEEGDGLMDRRGSITTSLNERKSSVSSMGSDAPLNQASDPMIVFYSTPP